MQKQKVLHFIESEGVYGAESVILNLSQQMQQHSELIPVVGCIVSNINEHSALYDAALSLGIDAIKIVISNRRLLIDIPRAAKQLKEFSISLIHSHGYKPSVFGFILGKLARIPIMATCHLWFDPNNGPLKMRVMIRLEKLFYRRFPSVVGVSQPIRDVLIAAGIPRERTQLVRNGVDFPELNLTTFERNELRKNLGIHENAFCILNTGRLTKQKSQTTLISAAALLKQQQVQFKLLIVGEGELKTELQKQIDALELNDCVSLLGFRNDIDKLLAISDVFALPSLDEGMPMSLLEAAAAKVPVITTAVGDIPKLITNNETGLIIPIDAPDILAKAICTLIEDKIFAKKLAERAFELMAENYSSQAMYKSYASIYQRLIGQTPVEQSSFGQSHS
jgi:glycosyltransferase involved in cell wall biosynthesis